MASVTVTAAIQAAKDAQVAQEGGPTNAQINTAHQDVKQALQALTVALKKKTSTVAECVALADAFKTAYVTWRNLQGLRESLDDAVPAVLNAVPDVIVNEVLAAALVS